MHNDSYRRRFIQKTLLSGVSIGSLLCTTPAFADEIFNNNTKTVDGGTDPTWAVNGKLIIGTTGTGEVDIINGGGATLGLNSTLTMGLNLGSTGTLKLTDLQWTFCLVGHHQVTS